MGQNLNPFEVLGLDPRLVARLKPRQLDQLIAATGRALKAMFHTDQADGGDIDRFIEINTASQILNRAREPEAFEEARKKFLDKAKRSKITQLALELEEVRRSGASALHAFADYLLKNATSGEEPRINRLMGYRIKLLDRVLLFTTASQRYRQGSSVGFYSLEFTKEGNSYVSGKGKSRKIYERVPVGTIPLATFQKFGSLEKFLSNSGEPAPRRLVSPNDIKEILSTGVPSYSSEKRAANYLQDNIKYEFNMQQMLKVINRLTAEVKLDHVLISVTENERGAFFYAEGVILGIEPLR